MKSVKQQTVLHFTQDEGEILLLIIKTKIFKK